ncbi:NlpC/P60 family protein [Streptomyces sp. NPDC002812]|uniref:C40 family peptidase n=1 Tax=unclassified Streptomyces TaxID=2593676 RepID=UPI0020308B94|nr:MULTISPECIES: C40 family peptidase [unclassified Streptomyces]MCM1968944.1 NlpC/P60 family protein [Streptomyces sp. G1]MCX5125306.1 NlpC/P60 family protein [Streptomyces sp. NBC_00347]MCX5298876.1 NlpC/P60 family protein [Streptomyces sp. NBC_00193]
MASHRRSGPSALDRNTKVTVLTAAAAGAAVAMSGAPAGAAPGLPQEPSTGTRAQVDRLFEEAEQATERFNQAGERAGRLRTEVARVQDAVARGQDRINTMRGVLGAYAGAQYRAGGIDPAVELMLSDDPDDYLAKAAALDRLSGRQARQLDELRSEQRRLGQERQEASRKLAELDALRADVAKEKRAVTAKLAAARRLLNAMPSQERADFDRASRSGGRPDALPELPDPAASGPSSGRAMTAVMAARSAVGRPYVWGSTGPSGFDCSGLMVWSYRQAGVALPRTSQAQRHAGRRVPLSEARPGDLVTYRSDASHVGMYVGNGQVVHAPYPGARVRYDPVGMMPVSSVTRP